MKISIEEVNEETLSLEVEGKSRELVKMVTQGMLANEHFEWVITEAVKQFTLAKIFGVLASEKEREKVEK